MGALGNPVKQDMGTGVQSVGCRAQKAGCRLWGVGHQAWDAGHELPVGQYCPGGVMAVRCQCDALYCVKLSFYLRRELRAAKEQVFLVFFFFFYCFDTLMIIFSLIFPPPVSSCVGSYHGEIGLWV